MNPTSDQHCYSHCSPAGAEVKRPMGVAIRSVSMSTTASTMMETTSRSSGCTVEGASGSSHYRMPLEDGPENDLPDVDNYHEMMSEDTEWCLDSLIAETSARWKQQLHDSLRSSSSSHLCARLQPEASSLSSSLALADAAAPTLSESPQRMVITDREPHESTEQELLQRRILSQQRREIQSLRAQLVAASKASAPTASSVPPTHIVLLTAHGAADDDLIADDDLTLDL
jgi:hypothetical protein